MEVPLFLDVPQALESSSFASKSRRPALADDSFQSSELSSSAQARPLALATSGFRNSFPKSPSNAPAGLEFDEPESPASSSGLSCSDGSTIQDVASPITPEFPFTSLEPVSYTQPSASDELSRFYDYRCAPQLEGDGDDAAHHELHGHEGYPGGRFPSESQCSLPKSDWRMKRLPTAPPHHHHHQQQHGSTDRSTIHDHDKSFATLDSRPCATSTPLARNRGTRPVLPPKSTPERPSVAHAHSSPSASRPVVKRQPDSARTLAPSIPPSASRPALERQPDSTRLFVPSIVVRDHQPSSEAGAPQRPRIPTGASQQDSIASSETCSLSDFPIGLDFPPPPVAVGSPVTSPFDPHEAADVREALRVCGGQPHWGPSPGAGAGAGAGPCAGPSRAAAGVPTLRTWRSEHGMRLAKVGRRTSEDYSYIAMDVPDSEGGHGSPRQSPRVSGKAPSRSPLVERSGESGQHRLPVRTSSKNVVGSCQGPDEDVTPTNALVRSCAIKSKAHQIAGPGPDPSSPSVRPALRQAYGRTTHTRSRSGFPASPHSSGPSTSSSSIAPRSMGKRALTEPAHRAIASADCSSGLSLALMPRHAFVDSPETKRNGLILDFGEPRTPLPLPRPDWTPPTFARSPDVMDAVQASTRAGRPTGVKTNASANGVVGDEEFLRGVSALDRLEISMTKLMSHSPQQEQQSVNNSATGADGSVALKLEPPRLNQPACKPTSTSHRLKKPQPAASPSAWQPQIRPYLGPKSSSHSGSETNLVRPPLVHKSASTTSLVEKHSTSRSANIARKHQSSVNLPRVPPVPPMRQMSHRVANTRYDDGKCEQEELAGPGPHLASMRSFMDMDATSLGGPTRSLSFCKKLANKASRVVAWGKNLGKPQAKSQPF